MMRSLPSFKMTPPIVAAALPLLQSVGRKNAAPTFAGACPAYITGSSGCDAFNPTLAQAPGAATKFTFEPAGGDGTRFYIKQNVREAAFGCSRPHLHTAWAWYLCAHACLYSTRVATCCAMLLLHCSPARLPAAARAMWAWTRPSAGGRWV